MGKRHICTEKGREASRVEETAYKLLHIKLGSKNQVINLIRKIKKRYVEVPSPFQLLPPLQQTTLIICTYRMQPKDECES